jgi:hypothetical protein
MSGYIGSKASVTLVDGYTQVEADAEFVAKAGDTMTGGLTVGGAFTSLGIDDNATSTAVAIDSAGRVTMPYQPIAAYSDTRSINLADVELTSSNFYNSQFVNRGGHFNTSTGRFTCPVGGVYRIMWRHTESVNANVRLQKNGATISEGYSSNQGTHNSVSAFAVVNCAANDYLSIQVSDFQTIGGTQHKFVSFELIS